MPNTPDVNPLTADLEDIRHADESPDSDDQGEAPAEPAEEETEAEAAARIQRETIDLA